MKKILIPIFLIVFAFQAGKSQTNQKRIHGNTATEVKKLIKLPNGGWTVLSENRLYSLDASENVIWSKEFPPLADKTAFVGSSIVRLDDGSYVIAGYFLRPYVTPNQIITLIKTDASGNIIWSKQVSDGRLSGATFIVKTKDGGFALTGTALPSLGGSTNVDAFVIKLDGDANFKWASIIGAGNEEYGYSLVQTQDGGYAVTGRAYVKNVTSDIFVAKLTSAGALLWTKEFGDGGYDYGKKIIETTDGGLAVMGDHGTVPTSGFTNDIFLVKLTSNGTLQWAKYYGGNDNDYSGSFIQTIDGGYAITARSYSFTNVSSDCYNLKTDASGNLLISKATPGYGNVIFANGSGYIVGGYYSGNSFYDGALINLDASLNTCNSRNVTTTTHTSTRSVDAAFHKNDRVFTVSPLAFTSINSPVTITQICGTSSAIAKTPESAKQDFTASIYPNPVKDNLYVQLSASNTVDAEMRIINQMGVVFLSRNALITSGNQTEIVNTSSLKNGMYFLSVSTKEGNRLIPFSKQ